MTTTRDGAQDDASRAPCLLSSSQRRRWRRRRLEPQVVFVFVFFSYSTNSCHLQVTMNHHRYHSTQRQPQGLETLCISSPWYVFFFFSFCFTNMFFLIDLFFFPTNYGWAVISVKTAQMMVFCRLGCRFFFLLWIDYDHAHCKWHTTIVPLNRNFFSINLY